MPRVFTSWSGGKDGCLALHRARAGGLDIRCLANTVKSDKTLSWSHDVSAAAIRRQAEAMGIPIVQQPTTGDAYEAEFIKMLKKLKAEGIEGGVFGDIEFDLHRKWIENVCQEAGITPYLPLWGEDQEALMNEFLDAGFVAVVVTVNAEYLSKDFVGQVLDRDFMSRIDEMSREKEVTPCGEAGEFHTLVIDGPVFQKRLEITESRKVTRDGYHFLEILDTELKNKHPVMEK